MPQDLPPAGGYEPIQYKRNLPIRGFRPAYYLLAMGVVMTYGFYKYGLGAQEQTSVTILSTSTQPNSSLLYAQSRARFMTDVKPI